MFSVLALATTTLVACSEQQPVAAAFDERFSAAAASPITVSPASSSIDVGGTIQLSARTTDGATADARWKSANTAIATVTETGLVTGRGYGSVVITAQTGKEKATAAITVAAAPTLAATVASVQVEPASATLTVGNTISLIATAHDSAGNALLDRTIAWSSSNAAVASVSAAGLVTAVAAGTANIIATSEGKNGTSVLTVQAPASPPPTGGIVNECAAPKAGWIFCDDYEQDRFSKYFEYVSASGSFTKASGVGVGGSLGMKARWGTVGQVGAGNLKVAFGRTPSTYMRPVDAGTADYRDIYWRVYVRTQPNWVGGGYKFTRGIVFASSNWAEAAMGHLWTGATTTVLTLDPVSGTDAAGALRTTTYNDFANMRWLGAASGKTALFDAAHVGSWYCVETHMKLNDAGASNGIFEFWVDGNLEARRADLNWLGSYSAYGINAVFLENYWNNGVPQVQERYFDNFVVSTQRIGC